MSGRKLYYDVIRIVALISVVTVHVSGYFVFSYPAPLQTEFVVGNAVNGLFRVGVPLFVMLSGALLLNEDKPFDVKRFYESSLLWMGLLLIFWLLVYGVFYGFILPGLTGRVPSWKSFGNYILTFEGSNYPHLWYMFMITGGYLTIPVLRLFVKKENRSYIFWMIVGCMIFQFSSVTVNAFLRKDALISVTEFMGKFHLESLTGYLGYFLLGWYLSNFEIKKTSRIILYVIAAVAVIAGIFAVQNKITAIPTVRKNFYSELSLPPFLYGMAVFVFIKVLCERKITKSKILIALSTDSFGIYMMHVMFFELFVVLFPYAEISIGILSYILISFLSVFILSWFTVWAIGKIPHVKKIFYLK